MNRKQFYKTKAWQHCRDAYARSKGGLCERCLKQGVLSAGVIVHHKVYLSDENFNDPSIALDWNNLELLCRNCHGAEHSGKRFTIDEFGRVTAVC